MILPKKRDPRFITIRRGGTLTDADHRLLALWAAACAEHVLHFFESERPSDRAPRGDRGSSGVDAWRDQDDGVTHRRRACDGSGPTIDRSGSARRLRRWSGWGSCARGCPRTGCSGLCDQGGPCCCCPWRRGGDGASRVSMAARTTSRRFLMTPGPVALRR